MAFLLIVIFSNVSFAQSYKFLPKNSKKLTSEQLQGKRISPTLPAYTQEGIKLDQMQLMKMMSSPEFMAEFYGDKSGAPVAILFRESTDQEREAKLSGMMSRDQTGKWKGKTAPPLVAMTMKEEGFNLAELKGKVVAINFWFIGCKPCLIEIPELNEVVAKYKDQNVVFLSIALDAKNQLIPFLQRTSFDYEVIPDGRSIAKKFDVGGYPTHFLIDQKGKVQFYQKGYHGALVSILDRKIEQLLGTESK